MASGDVDGDGDLDLVVANDFWATQVLINDGNGGFVDETAGRMISPALHDALLSHRIVEGDAAYWPAVDAWSYEGMEAYSTASAVIALYSLP